MKVICIKKSYRISSRSSISDLTIGKSYEIISGEFNNPTSTIISIYDDKNTLLYLPSEFFISKEEYRNNKLKEIGI